MELLLDGAVVFGVGYYGFGVAYAVTVAAESSERAGTAALQLLSLGRADAMMIVCKDVLLADSYATAMANRIKTVNDLQPVIESIQAIPEIQGALAIKDDQLAVTGQYELRLFH